MSSHSEPASPRERVLVTGASAGIGRELARCFARDGAELILVARRVARLEAVAAELRRETGVEVRTAEFDLAAPGVAPRVLDAAGDVDVLVNNAGFGVRGRSDRLPLQRQLEMVRLHVDTLVELSLRVLPRMVARRRGGVLNVASIAAFQPGPGMATYFATKAFLLSYSEALHDELRPHGVTVTCLAPGPVETEFAEVADLRGSRLFRFGSMRADVVARAGYRAFRRGRALVVPGVRNRMLAFANRLGPRALGRRIAAALVRD